MMPETDARMQIVTGLPGTADRDYIASLVNAGAGEFFVGYVPPSWSNRFGYEVSPNRRYRAEEQLGSRAVLERLVGQAHEFGVPVTLTVNEHTYTGEMWAATKDLVEEALECGVDGLIVASPAACASLRKRFPSCTIHVSGEAGVVNAAGLRFFADLGVKRMIFGREIGLPVLGRLGPAARKLGMEVEAFAMGEPCVYDGARCFACHGYGAEKDYCNEHLRKDIKHRDKRPGPVLPPVLPPKLGATEDTFVLGKCGLCAVSTLRSMGVTHLKVPGRSSAALRGVELLAEVCDKPGMSLPEIQAMLGKPALCQSRRFCYYPEILEQDAA
ncbi:MAG: peptidase U32 family protein [Myxococcota bacterium]